MRSGKVINHKRLTKDKWSKLNPRKIMEIVKGIMDIKYRIALVIVPPCLVSGLIPVHSISNRSIHRINIAIIFL